jgi:hypothetical protein
MCAGGGGAFGAGGPVKTIGDGETGFLSDPDAESLVVCLVLTVILQRLSIDEPSEPIWDLGFRAQSHWTGRAMSS